MRKPKIVFGSYEVDELKWHFFTDEQEAIDFQLEKENRIGPQRFSFDDALQQFSNDLCAIPGTLFVTEDEFVKVARGEEVELSFFSSENEDEDDLGEVENKESSRPDPSEGYFKEMEEALKWLRSAARFVLTETDFPSDYPEMIKVIRNGGWKIIEYDGMNLLDFVKSLSLVCTVLRSEIFEETLHELMYGDEV